MTRPGWGVWRWESGILNDGPWRVACGEKRWDDWARLTLFVSHVVQSRSWQSVNEISLALDFPYIATSLKSLLFCQCYYSPRPVLHISVPDG